MDTPYASGTESLASQIVVEAGDGLLCQVRQRRVSNAREDVAIDQIAVSTLGVAVPFASVADEPLVAPLPDRQGIFFIMWITVLDGEITKNERVFFSLHIF